MPKDDRTYKGRKGMVTRDKRGKKGDSDHEKLRKLESRVAKLTRATTMRAMFAITNSRSDVSNLYAYQQLIQPNFMAPIFQSAQNQKVTLSYDIKEVTIEAMFQIFASGLLASPVTCTYFVVSLKKEAAQQWIVDTNDGSQLRENIDYTNTSMGSTVAHGMTRLNPDIFHIHAVRRFIVSDVAYETADPLVDVNVTNVKDANHRLYLKIPWKKTIKAHEAGNTGVLGNVDGWGTMTGQQVEATDRLYCFLFNNCATVDVDFLSWHQSATIDGRVAQ